MSLVHKENEVIADGKHTCAPSASFVIYAHTNRMNGKRYVGQTSKGLMTRWAEHVKHATANRPGCSVFYAAIRKYTPTAFHHEVLAEVRTQDEANDAEIAWIAKLNARAPSGYNLEIGGHQGPIHESTRERLRIRANARETAKTANERAVIGSKISKSMTFEQRQIAAQKRHLAKTNEERSEAVRLGRSRMTAAERSAIAVRINAAIPPGVHSEACRLRDARMGQRARSEKTRKGWETRRARYGQAGHPRPYVKRTSLEATS
jgi:hypothetical protein